jgi:hypothetical protein
MRTTKKWTMATWLLAAMLFAGVARAGEGVAPLDAHDTGSGSNSILHQGSDNTAAGNYSAIGGGEYNAASGSRSTVGGGEYNTASGSRSTVGGGDSNTANETRATVGGGESNTASGSYATAAGGYSNEVAGYSGTICGGRLNLAPGFSATVAGGRKNAASGDNAAIVGGAENTAGGFASAIGGGQQNAASKIYAAVGGGYLNKANGDGAFVGGGRYNEASGLYACAPGGSKNRATAYAFAAGYRARAAHTGCFVWGDKTEANLVTTANNQFLARAKGGVKFFTNAAMTTGARLAAGSGSWTNLSDRECKKNFEDVDAREVLERLVEVPVRTWSYKSQDDSIRHMGATSQDLHAAFGLGLDDTGIATVDGLGVSMAAIQGLRHEKDAQIAELRQELADLKALVQHLAK